jgi:hypothetical protein
MVITWSKTTLSGLGRNGFRIPYLPISPSPQQRLLKDV